MLFVFVLALYFTCEKKHVAFGFVTLANFTLEVVFQFHPFICK
jgi:hypothetical protein